MPLTLAAIGALLTAGISGGLLFVLRDAAAASRLIQFVGRIPIVRVRRWAEAQKTAFVETDAASRAFFEAPLAPGSAAARTSSSNGCSRGSRCSSSCVA